VKLLFKLGAVAVLIGLLTSPTRSQLRQGERLIPFALKSIDGKVVTVKVEKGVLTVTKEDARGNLVETIKPDLILLDFWATWCPPCRFATPYMQKIHEKFFLEKFKGGKMKAKEKKGGVLVIGIGLDRAGSRAIKPFAQRNKLNYLMLADPIGRRGKLITDPMKLATAYEVRGIPTMFLIDSKGIIRFVHVGFGPGMGKLLEDQIKSIISGKGQG